MCLAVDQHDRTSTARIGGGAFVIVVMLVEAALRVGADPGIKTAVGTADHIDIPGLTIRVRIRTILDFCHRFFTMSTL